MAKILMIGLGGVGCEIINYTNELFQTRMGGPSPLACLGIDFEDHQGLNVFQDFEVSDAANTVRRLWQKDEKFRLQWPSTAGEPYVHTGAIGRTSAAGQIRANGRLAGLMNLQLDESTGIRPQIIRFLKEQGVADAKRPDDAMATPYYIFVVCSLGGGTGSGILQEVVYATRQQLKVQDFFLGVFLDGSVVKSWAPSKTGPMSYAALVEIEHWMTHAADYYALAPTESHLPIWKSVSEAPASGGRSLKDLTYLDLAIVFSEQNENQKLLMGRRTGSRKGDYVQLAAGWLYAFLLGDLLTKSKNASKVFENELIHFRGKRFVSKDDRSYTYGSGGISMLAVPINKIGRFLSASIIIESLEKQKGMGEPPPPAAKYLGERDIDEHLDGALSRKLRGRCSAYKAIDDRILGVKASLDRAGNYNHVVKTIKQYHLASPDNHWQPLLEKYKVALEQTVHDLLSDELEELDVLITKTLGHVSPWKLQEWLQALHGRLIKCTELVERNAVQQSTRWSSGLKSHTNEINAYGAFQRWMRWDDAKLMLGQDMEKLRGDLRRQEALTQKTRFYSGLSAGVLTRIQCLQKIIEPLEEILDTQIKEKARFTTRDSFIDESKLEANNHPLELEVGTHESFVKMIEGGLRETVNPEQLLERLAQAGDLPEAKLRWLGYGHFFRRFVQEYDKLVEDPSSPSEVPHLKREMLKVIETIIDQDVVNRVVDVLKQECTLWRALSSFLDERLGEAKTYKADTSGASNTERHFRMMFGGEGAADLLASTSFKRDSWKSKALMHTVARLAAFSAPFWQQNQVLKDESKQLFDKASINRIIYCPDDEIAKMLGNNTSAALRGFNVCAFQDKHALAVVQLVRGYPLFSLLGYEDDRLSYLEHVRKWNDGSEVEPYHVDQRFYTVWKDDIMQLEGTNAAKQETIYLLYLLSIGSGTMTVGAKGRRKYSIGNKSLALGLPKLIRKLNEDENSLNYLRKETASVIISSVASAAHGSRPAQEEIWTIILKGMESHLSAKPPDTKVNAQSYSLWEKIRDCGALKKRKDGTWDIGGTLVPKSRENFDRLEQILKK